MSFGVGASSDIAVPPVFGRWLVQRDRADGQAGKAVGAARFVYGGERAEPGRERDRRAACRPRGGWPGASRASAVRDGAGPPPPAVTRGERPGRRRLAVRRGP